MQQYAIIKIIIIAHSLPIRNIMIRSLKTTSYLITSRTKPVISLFSACNNGDVVCSPISLASTRYWFANTGRSDPGVNKDHHKSTGLDEEKEIIAKNIKEEHEVSELM